MSAVTRFWLYVCSFQRVSPRIASRRDVAPAQPLVLGSVDYDYAESGDARFNDARCDLWRFLRMGEAMVVVCKIDSVGVRTVLPLVCARHCLWEGRN